MRTTQFELNSFMRRADAEPVFVLTATPEGITLQHIVSQRTVNIDRSCQSILPPNLFDVDYSEVAEYVRCNWDDVLMASAPHRNEDDEDSTSPDDPVYDAYRAAEQKFQDDVYSLLKSLLSGSKHCHVHDYWNTAHDYYLDCYVQGQSDEYLAHVQATVEAVAQAPFKAYVSFM